MMIPYGVLWLLTEHQHYKQQAADAALQLSTLQSQERSDPKAIRFVDDKGTERLVVGSNRIVYIESAGNYVNIVYENGSRLVRFSLRNTLKGIESLCAANGLVRCHRSYFINLRKVKLLRKDTESVYAEMDADQVADIPVSKTYAAEVVRRFSASTGN